MQSPPCFDSILGILCSVLDAYSAVVFLPFGGEKTKEGELGLACSFSLGDNVDSRSVIQEGKGMVGWIMRNQEPLLVSNFDQRRNYLGYYSASEEKSIKAFMGCPLPGGAGVVCVDSKRQYSFAEKDQKILQLFARLLGQLQEENQNNAEGRETVKYYTALRTVYTLRHQYSRWADFLKNFLDLMAAVSGFSYCMLCTRDSHGENYSVEGENKTLLRGQTEPSFPMTHGVVGWVFRNSSPVVSDGPDGTPDTPLVGNGTNIPHFQTVMAQPLNIQRKTRGVLCLANENPVKIDENTKDFVRMASEHLALFLENLYVKCRLRDLHQAMRDSDAEVRLNEV